MVKGHSLSRAPPFTARAPPVSRPTAPLSLQAARAEPSESAGGYPGELLSEVARQNLLRAGLACRRYGWISFWVQLVLTCVAAVITLFSLAFTTQARPPARPPAACAPLPARAHRPCH